MEFKYRHAHLSIEECVALGLEHKDYDGGLVPLEQMSQLLTLARRRLYDKEQTVRALRRGHQLSDNTERVFALRRDIPILSVVLADILDHQRDGQEMQPVVTPPDGDKPA